MTNEVKDIILEFLESNNQKNETVLSLVKWFSTDDIIEWFIDSYFAHDENEMYANMEEDKVVQLLTYYNKHVY